MRQYRPKGKNLLRVPADPQYHRRLSVEQLEQRAMLSVVSIPTSIAAQHETLSGLPFAAQQAVSKAIGQDQSAYHAASAAVGVNLANPANGFTANVRSGALQIATGPDTWDMSLVGLAFGGAVQPVGTAQTSVNGNRVDNNYGTVDEWYVNGPSGLEQGFTVPPLPQSEASGSLTVVLALGGDLVGTVNAAGSGLNLTRPDGSTALGYAGLTAYDATGKALPASLEVRSDGGRQILMIHVVDVRAEGPITIDPFVQQTKLTASDGHPGDDFGYSISISDNTVVVGATDATVGGNQDQGAAYVFTDSGGVWTQTAKLTASDGAPDASFGYSVSISGTTIVVGANDANNGGAAYVFTESGSVWTQTAELTAPNAVYFGESVSISGSTLVVSAMYSFVDGNYIYLGAAYVFTGSGSSWTQVAKLSESVGQPLDLFGYSDSISGNTIVVGAYDATVDGNQQQGAAYVFVEPGTGWVSMQQTAVLTAADGAAGDIFGQSVSVSGNTIVVGANDATIEGKREQGAAYLFTEPGPGWASMTQTAKLVASDGAAGDHFGDSVSIVGSTVVVGAYSATVDGNQQGVAYVFIGSGSAWTQAAKLTASDLGNTGFGNSVSISGSRIVVGDNAALGNTGAAYVYAPPAAVTAVSTTAAADSVYTVGETVPIAVTFSETVNVFGAPQLALNDGGVATYVSGSGTPTLTFSYTVATGQNTTDLDYASTAALALGGGSIQDTSDNAASLALPVPATDPDGLAAQNVVIETPLIVTASEWTSAGLTLTLGGDGNIHVYITDTTTDAVPPVAPASVTDIEITAPDSTTASLTLDSTNGNPIPAGGVTYSGGGGLIKTGPGVVTLTDMNTYEGDTVVDAGTLAIDSAIALPNGGSLTVGADASGLFNARIAGPAISAISPLPERQVENLSYMPLLASAPSNAAIDAVFASHQTAIDRTAPASGSAPPARPWAWLAAIESSWNSPDQNNAADAALDKLLAKYGV